MIMGQNLPFVTFSGKAYGGEEHDAHAEHSQFGGGVAEGERHQGPAGHV